MFLNSSQDILNLSLAVSVFSLAFLIGWILVYFLMIIRRMVKILEGVEENMTKLSELMSVAKTKLENSTSYLSILASGAKELVSYFMASRSRKSAKKNSR